MLTLWGKTRQNLLNVSFRFKLFGAFLIVLLIPIFFISYFSLQVIVQRLDDQQNKEIEYISKSATDALEQFQQRASAYGTLLSNNDLIIQALIIGDRGIATKPIMELYNQTKKDGVDYLQIVDHQGNVMINGHDMRKFGESRTNTLLIQEALKGKRVSASSIEDIGMVFLTATPVYNSTQQIIGVVTVGYLIDQEMVQKIKENTGSDIAVFQRNRAIASTFKEKNQEKIDFRVTYKPIIQTVLQKAHTYEAQSTIHKIPYSVAYVPILDIQKQPIGMMMITVSRQTISDAVYNILKNQLIIIILSILFVLAIGFILSKILVQPLLSLLSYIEKAANGDISSDIQVTSQDEFGKISDKFNLMLRQWRTIISELTHVSKDVYEKSVVLNSHSTDIIKQNSNIGATVERFSEGTDYQSINTNNIASSLQEMSGEMHVVTENLEYVEKSTQKVLNNATNGRKVMDNVVNKMNEIHSSVQNSSDSIKQLSARSDEIKKIVTIINQIAEDTNMLAVNASIEAAKSGEFGKGFMIIANEVRTLAIKSQEFSNEIQSILNEVVDDVDKSVKTMKIESQKVNNGVEEAQNAGKHFSDIVSEIEKVTQQISEVVLSSQTVAQESVGIVNYASEISNVSSDINQGTSDLTTQLEEQSIVTQNISQSAIELENLSKELNRLIQQFKM